MVKFFKTGRGVSPVHQYNGVMTCEQVDAMYPDDDVVSAESGHTNRYFRHLMFTRFVLGEPLRDAWRVAFAYSHTPLSLEAMHYVASSWNDEDWDGPAFETGNAEGSFVDVLGGV